ncbi:MAG TPA: hypothetical protein DHW14_04860 [Clostridiales bacterium]|nr:hypothetical protein [Clostridiales bacterium]
MSPMSCRRAGSLLSAYLDGELDPRTRLSLTEHLDSCAACRSELEALRATAALVRDLPREELPEGFHSALLRKVGAAAAAVSRGAVRPGRSLTGSPTAFWEGLIAGLRGRPFRVVAAAAAVVVLVLWAGSFAFYLGADVPGFELLGLRGKGDVGRFPEGGYTASGPGAEPPGMGSVAAPDEHGGTKSADGLEGTASPSGADDGLGAGDFGALGLDAAPGRQIILTAHLSLACEDVAAAKDRAVAAVESAGGFVESLTYWDDGSGGRSASMVLRVPTERLAETLAQLRSLGRLLSEQVSRQDITSRYIDISARVNNLRQQEQRLLALLGRAESLSDILVLENELARVRTEIERYERTLRSFDEQVAMSTVHLELVPPKETPGPGAGLWERIAAAFMQSLLWLWNAAQALLVFLAGLLAPLAVLGLLVWLGVVVVRTRRRRAGM